VDHDGAQGGWLPAQTAPSSGGPKKVRDTTHADTAAQSAEKTAIKTTPEEQRDQVNSFEPKPVAASDLRRSKLVSFETLPSRNGGDHTHRHGSGTHVRQLQCCETSILWIRARGERTAHNAGMQRAGPGREMSSTKLPRPVNRRLSSTRCTRVPAYRGVGPLVALPARPQSIALTVIAE
jgi:hypothetical protein